MLTVTPEVEAVLARAAQLRAEGSSWANAARAVGYDGDDLRDAGKTYDRLYATARREGLAESVFTLRRMLRDDDPREARRAVECLARVGVIYYRPRSRAAAGGPGRVPVRTDRSGTPPPCPPGAPPPS